MNNSRLISLIIVFLILLVLSLIPILSGKTVFQLSKGSQGNPFQYYKTKRATEWWEVRKVEENRQWPRSIVNWPVAVTTSQRTIRGETRNVSPGGAFIYCDRPMTPKHIFFLSIHIHSSTVSVSSMAESVWSTHDGIGVRFHLDSPEQSKLISKFISDAWRPKDSLFKKHVEVTGFAFLLASGLRELIRDVSMVAHSFQPFFMLAPGGIGSMGVLFSTPSMPAASLSPWLPLIMQDFLQKWWFFVLT